MYISSTSNQSTSDYYQQLSSGKKINTAADDAAGLAIAQKLQSEENGYDTGGENAAMSQNMVDIADSGLAAITDYLQRIRELSIRASNSFFGAAEKEAIQLEIDHMKQGIADAVHITEYNEMNLLDGSMGSTHVASNPDGSGMDVAMPGATLAALGIADYDITGDFDISVIDKALHKVSSSRSSLGAASNRLSHTMNFNSAASYNLTAARSQLEDTNYARAISEKEKVDVLRQYQVMVQKKRMESDAGIVRLLKP